MKMKLQLNAQETSYGEVIGFHGSVDIEIDISPEKYEQLTALLKETNDFSIFTEGVDNHE